jgi:hypothetical protein
MCCIRCCDGCCTHCALVVGYVPLDSNHAALLHLAQHGPGLIVPHLHLHHMKRKGNRLSPDEWYMTRRCVKPTHARHGDELINMLLQFAQAGHCQCWLCWISAGAPHTRFVQAGEKRQAGCHSRGNWPPATSTAVHCHWPSLQQAVSREAMCWFVQSQCWVRLHCAAAG